MSPQVLVLLWVFGAVTKDPGGKGGRGFSCITQKIMQSQIAGFLPKSLFFQRIHRITQNLDNLASHTCEIANHISCHVPVLPGMWLVWPPSQIIRVLYNRAQNNGRSTDNTWPNVRFDWSTSHLSNVLSNNQITVDFSSCLTTQSKK